MRRGRVGIGFGFAGGVPPAVVTWNPAAKGTDISLTNGDLDANNASSSGVWNGVVGSLGQSSGSRYFELTPTAGTDSPARFFMLGIITGDHTSLTGPTPNGSGATSAVVIDTRAAENGVGDTKAGAWTTDYDNVFPIAVGDVIGIAVVLSGGTIKVWWSINGDYGLVGNAAANPATGANPHAIHTGTETYYPAAWMLGFGTTETLRIAASGSGAGSPPSGFVWWNA